MPQGHGVADGILRMAWSRLAPESEAMNGVGGAETKMPGFQATLTKGRLGQTSRENMNKSWKEQRKS